MKKDFLDFVDISFVLQRQKSFYFFGSCQTSARVLFDIASKENGDSEICMLHSVIYCLFLRLYTTHAVFGGINTALSKASCVSYQGMRICNSPAQACLSLYL